MKKQVLFFIIYISMMGMAVAQDLYLVKDSHKDLAEKLSVLFPDARTYSSAIRSYQAEAVINFALSHYPELSPGDKAILLDMMNHFDQKKHELPALSVEEQKQEGLYAKRKPTLKYFYKNAQHFLSVDADGFSLRANPIVQLSYGNASNDGNRIFQNTRGAELSGYIDRKIYFYTRVLENQQRFLPQTEQYIQAYSAIPQQGFYKAYNSAVIDGLTGYDFLNAQACIGLPISKSVSLEFGHGRHFMGNGLRSLLLSDFSNNYLYLKFDTRVWKLHYQNIFAELNATSANQFGGDELLTKKYMATHYLSFRPLPWAEVGIFESVIFSRKNQFELQYLNPVIFYRMVEQFLGSSDNALLGLNASVNFKNKVRLYGQLMLDEFNLGFFKQDGWWGNKYGIQAGMKWHHPFSVDQLDVQLEYNMVRPFTYSHDRTEDGVVLTSYTHYNMPLAHPLGSNFREWLTRVTYRGVRKLELVGDVVYMQSGKDQDGKNYGADPRINNVTRFQDFGNKLLQGSANDVLFLRLNLTYELWKNYQVFLNPQYRKTMNPGNLPSSDHLYLGGGISINLALDKNIF
ncbi:MAG: hypothetical protein IPN29_20775 [Saprospiraceae bacterium]|nr:hypothetical protein [Saprospiraceae bacterium]